MQRVEEKVRVKLHFERGQIGVGQLYLQLRGPQLTLLKAPVVKESLCGGDGHGIGEHGHQKVLHIPEVQVGQLGLGHKDCPARICRHGVYQNIYIGMDGSHSESDERVNAEVAQPVSLRRRQLLRQRDGQRNDGQEEIPEQKRVLKGRAPWMLPVVGADDLHRVDGPEKRGRREGIEEDGKTRGRPGRLRC